MTPWDSLTDATGGTTPQAIADLTRRCAELAVARRFAEAARSPQTDRAYSFDWRHFAEWASSHPDTRIAVPTDWHELAEPISPAVVALYATSLAVTQDDDGAPLFKPATIDRRMAAISVAHKRNGLPSPTGHPQVREILSGIRRELRAPSEPVAPLTAPDIRRIIDRLEQIATRPENAVLRDRALLLVGYAAALRRSELVALNWTDAEDHEGGLVVTVRASKTDQEGRGARVPVARGRDRHTCPVRALRDWEDVARVDGSDGSTPIFRRVDRWGSIGTDRLSGKAVARIVKRAAEGAGMDPDRYAGHSLRAGFATTAASNGATERQIAKVTRHRSMNVLRGYIREANLFVDSAAEKAGL